MDTDTKPSQVDGDGEVLGAREVPDAANDLAASGAVASDGRLKAQEAFVAAIAPATMLLDDRSWLTDGLSQLPEWEGVVGMHGPRLVGVTSDLFQVPRLFPLLCFMSRALGEHVYQFGEHPQGECSAALEVQEMGWAGDEVETELAGGAAHGNAEGKAGVVSGELTREGGEGEPSSLSNEQTQFAPLAATGVQFIDGKYWVTTERVIRFGVDGRGSGDGKFVSLRRSANMAFREAAQLGWIDHRCVKLPSGPRVNIWSFLPEGIGYIATGLVARERVRKLGRASAEAICTELGVDEREERRDELKDRRALAQSCVSGVPASAEAGAGGANSVSTKSEVAEVISQEALQKTKLRVQQAKGSVMWAGLLGA
ncbi:hypothetical protein [Hydrogenophaga sp. OTU3427]|uniref:hypothetical protein n=1 Tax=Hydrogenophaga sp. OTU3427 TaxID=3043856 RepID=UPI00313D1EB6